MQVTLCAKHNAQALSPLSAITVNLSQGAYQLTVLAREYANLGSIVSTAPGGTWLVDAYQSASAGPQSFGATDTVDGNR